MQLLSITVGKKPSSELAALIYTYQKRIEQKHTFVWHYVQPNVTSDIAKSIEVESNSILSLIRPNDNVILLDETGDLKNNLELSEKLADMFGSHGRVVFIIGGAYGVSESVFERADFVWSMSKLVFPHQVMRLMLVEQLYRSIAIQENHPYHHL